MHAHTHNKKLVPFTFFYLALGSNNQNLVWYNYIFDRKNVLQLRIKITFYIETFPVFIKMFRANVSPYHKTNLKIYFHLITSLLLSQI